MSTKQERYATIEERLEATWQAGDLRGAGELAVREYGPEILGYLVARIRNRDVAEDAFSQGQEDFWHAWPSFRWACPARSFMFRVFTNAANRWHRDRYHDPALRAGLSSADGAAASPSAQRTPTAPYLRTTIKTRYRLLRDQLPEEERALLILKVDKGFSWREVAEILHSDADLDDAGWKREADRRAQQFRRLKERLRRELAEGGRVGRNVP